MVGGDRDAECEGRLALEGVRGLDLLWTQDILFLVLDCIYRSTLSIYTNSKLLIEMAAILLCPIPSHVSGVHFAV